MRLALGLGILVLAPIPLRACLNDRDTASNAAQGLPEVRAVIVGRFDRNPPLYYEMRLKRVAEAIAADPRDLAAYDDAAVACDRLGRFDEAIAWMDQKRVRLERADPADPVTKEHWYRYHANVGTHRAHRWLKNGADRSRLGEMKTARDHIARALAIKPDAHFGREAYQLRAMDWIINPPSFGPGVGTLPSFLDNTPDPPAEAIAGLCGLIVLGNAWESVDVFNALAHALDAYHDRSTADLARLRCLELIDAGRASLLPDAPRGAGLADLVLGGGQFVSWHSPAGASYRQARAPAEDQRRRRDAFMLARLGEGRHPDTDQFFWEGEGRAFAPGAFDEEKPLKLSIAPSRVRRQAPRALVGFQVALAILAIPTCLVLMVLGLLTVLRTMRASATHMILKPAAEDPDWV